MAVAPLHVIMVAAPLLWGLPRDFEGAGEGRRNENPLPAARAGRGCIALLIEPSLLTRGLRGYGYDNGYDNAGYDAWMGGGNAGDGGVCGHEKVSFATIIRPFATPYGFQVFHVKREICLVKKIACLLFRVAGMFPCLFKRLSGSMELLRQSRQYVSKHRTRGFPHMPRKPRGSLLIVALADDAAKNEAAELLAGADDIPIQEAKALLERLPLHLREDIPRDQADEIAQYLQGIGVATEFRAQDAKPPKASRKGTSPQDRKSASAARRIPPGRHLLFPALLFILAAVLVWWIVTQK